MKLQDFDFRIWHKDSYLDDPAYAIYRFCVEKDFDECFKHECFNEVEIELWSGLKDCKGRKIFEGDIVKNIELETDYRVEFYKGEILLLPLKYEGRISFQRDMAIRFCVLASEASEILDSFEIIGNIHDEEVQL